MQILHLSTSDIEGGAARAAYRLHQGLRTIGVNSQMLVRAKFSIDQTVIAQKNLLTKLGPPVDGLPLKLFSHPNRTTRFSLQWCPDSIVGKVEQINPNIVHLHWICNGYLQVETLAQLKKPLVWTLHDMWPFTGGCHYTQECDRYTHTCGACPQLISDRDRDLSRWIWQRKSKAWKNLDLTIVSPSTWLADQAKLSSLFQEKRIEVIPHGLNLEKYKPIESETARKLLNLPLDKKLILFGAESGALTDNRKGFQLLQPALKSLKKDGWQDKIELIIFGAAQPETLIDLSFPCHYMGRLHDDISLALVYSAADVMIVPSIQEAFGQTASESLACGTPVVAFAATGLKDIVTHQQDGYLAQPFESDDLARGISWVLEDSDRSQSLRQMARQKAEREFSLQLQASRYLSLFTEIFSS